MYNSKLYKRANISALEGGMASVAQRLLTAMTARGVDQAQLAEAVGCSQGAISQILTGSTQRSRFLPDIAIYLRVPLEWLKGHGAEEDFEKSALAEIPDADDDFVTLEEVDLDYGLGAAYGDSPVSVQLHKMPRLLMEAMTESPASGLFVTRGVGDSMQPVINHGDLVIIDRSQRTIGRDDQIWALAISGMHTIKRVRIRGQEVRLLSPNPDVGNDVATAEEVHVIGKVVFVGRRM